VRRPPVPPPAERAKTLAARPGIATLTCRDSTDRIAPPLHHVHPDGSVTMLLPREHPVVATTSQAPRPGSGAMLEIRDYAPVPLREPVRGLLWITGWVTVLTGEQAHRSALDVAQQQPDPRLLDAGHSASVLRLTPASIVISDGEGTESLAPAEFSSAAPDPFHSNERDWLQHLQHAHPNFIGMLGRHLPNRLRIGIVRPLGLDRLGLRLRVEAKEDDHDVRLAYARPVTTPTELSVELRRLIGCPFLHARQ
jgi:hypothetical protein